MLASLMVQIMSSDGEQVIGIWSCSCKHALEFFCTVEVVKRHTIDDTRAEGIIENFPSFLRFICFVLLYITSLRQPIRFSEYGQGQLVSELVSDYGCSLVRIQLGRNSGPKIIMFRHHVLSRRKKESQDYTKMDTGYTPINFRQCLYKNKIPLKKCLHVTSTTSLKLVLIPRCTHGVSS